MTEIENNIFFFSEQISLKIFHLSCLSIMKTQTGPASWHVACHERLTDKVHDDPSLLFGGAAKWSFRVQLK